MTVVTRASLEPHVVSSGETGMGALSSEDGRESFESEDEEGGVSRAGAVVAPGEQAAIKHARPRPPKDPWTRISSKFIKRGIQAAQGRRARCGPPADSARKHAAVPRSELAHTKANVLR
jgi:hypothetical protein